MKYLSGAFFSDFWTHKNNLQPNDGGSNNAFFFPFLFKKNQGPDIITKRKRQRSNQGNCIADLTHCFSSFPWLLVGLFWGDPIGDGGAESLGCPHKLFPSLPEFSQAQCTLQTNYWVDKWTSWSNHPKKD
jgi:hypothetical protein